jgi:hypothetical protein
MARTVKVMVTCDLCDTPVDENAPDITHRFGFDGKDYELDLCAKHGSEFVSTMWSWREKATVVSLQTTAGPPKAPKAPRANTPGRNAGKRSVPERKAELDRVREWARNNGFDVGDRGRIADNVVAAYRQATGDPVEPSPLKIPEVPPFGHAPVRSQGDNETEDYPPAGFTSEDGFAPPLVDAPSVPDMWDEEERVGTVRNPDGTPAGS